MTTLELGRDADTAEGDLRRFNSDGYFFITQRVLPRLSDLGASDADINAIIVVDPRGFLEGSDGIIYRPLGLTGETQAR